MHRLQKMERLSRDEVICTTLSHYLHTEIALEVLSVGTRTGMHTDVTTTIIVITAGVVVVAVVAIPTVIGTATATIVTTIPDIEKCLLQNRYARLCN